MEDYAYSICPLYTSDEKKTGREIYLKYFLQVEQVRHNHSPCNSTIHIYQSKDFLLDSKYSTEETCQRSAESHHRICNQSLIGTDPIV